jgi:hypothetical protein
MAVSDKDPAKPSIYTTLDIERYEIRILTLLPGTSEFDVKWRLVKTSLINRTKYAALSYCWGDPNVTTEIIVNDIATPVTINLADALRQLRRIGVSRIWADALCINQADGQEKSHQIRNMKHVYSRAEQTYAWIGKEETDRSAAAISFLHTVLYNSDDTIPAEISHDHQVVEVDNRVLPYLDAQVVGTCEPDLFPREPAPAQGGHICQRCLLEFQFRALQAFFNREYWKRRWVIPEIAVAPRIRVLCGNVGIELDEMSVAIARCRKSCYWLSETDSAYLHLQRVLEFRQCYQSGDNISLLRAIAKSHRSLSTEPRDIIFALLGICHDGSELIPTPNYKQPIETVLKGLTRTLIWRTSCLDVILINGMKRSPSTAGLPSWTPNWIRPSSLPSQAFGLAYMNPQYSRSFIPMSNVVDDNVLRVQGAIIATIVDTTSTLQSTSLPRPNLSEVGETSSSGNSLGPSYYHCRSEVFAALLYCLLTKNGWPVQDKEFSYCSHRHLPAHDRTRFGSGLIPWSTLAWHALRLIPERTTLDKSDSNSMESGEDPELVTRRAFYKWLIANGAVTIHGKSIQGWFSERDPWIRLVRTLDSRWGFPLFVAICVLEFIPGLVIVLASMISIRSCKTPICYSNLTLLITIPVFLLVPLFMVFEIELHIFIEIRFLANYIRRLLLETFQDEIESATRLVVSDKGFIGRACSRAETGDQICFLVGCTKPVVLRAIDTANCIQYRVVGKAVIALSWQDQERYRGFLQNVSIQNLETMFHMLCCLCRILPMQDEMSCSDSTNKVECFRSSN